jgi:hypothetical protein
MQDDKSNIWGFMFIGFTIFGIANIITWLLS